MPQPISAVDGARVPVAPAPVLAPEVSARPEASQATPALPPTAATDAVSAPNPAISFAANHVARARRAEPPESVQRVLERLAASAEYMGDNVRRTAAELNEAGLGWDESSELVTVALSRGKDQMWARLAALSTMAGLVKDGDASQLAAAAKFVLTYGDLRANEVADMAATLKLELTELSVERFPEAAAKAVNANAAERLAQEQAGYIWELSRFSSAIYGLHEGDVRMGGRDQLGERFARALDARGAYALLAGGFTSNDAWAYQAVLGAYKREVTASGKPMGELVAELDPRGHLTSSVVETLAQFDGTDVLVQGGSVFWDKLLKLLNGAGQATLIARTLKFFDERYAMLPGELRKQLEDTLTTAVESPTHKTTNPISKRASAAYMLRHLHEKGKALGAEARAIAARLPGLPLPQAPVDEWLSDGVVTAQMVYYPNEIWYGDSVKFYANQGFTKRPDLVATLELKPNDVVLERERHGVVQRIILTMNDEKTPYQLETSRSLMVVGGSCGSYGAMTDEEFLLRYGQHHLVADADTGEGLVNNYVMLLLLDGIAARRTDWRDYRLHIYDKRSIKAPQDIGFQLGGYSRAFAQWAGEALPAPPKSAATAKPLHSSVDILAHRGHAADFSNTFPMPGYGEE